MHTCLIIEHSLKPHLARTQQASQQTDAQFLHFHASQQAPNSAFHKTSLDDKGAFYINVSASISSQIVQVGQL